MAIDASCHSIGIFTAKAGGGAARYRFVKNDGFEVEKPSAGGAVTGVCDLDDPVDGQATRVTIAGVAKVEVGTVAVAKNDDVEVEATGAIVTQSAGVTVGQALVAGDPGELVEVLLTTGK